MVIRKLGRVAMLAAAISLPVSACAQSVHPLCEKGTRDLQPEQVRTYLSYIYETTDETYRPMNMDKAKEVFKDLKPFDVAGSIYKQTTQKGPGRFAFLYSYLEPRRDEAGKLGLNGAHILRLAYSAFHKYLDRFRIRNRSNITLPNYYLFDREVSPQDRIPIMSFIVVGEEHKLSKRVNELLKSNRDIFVKSSTERIVKRADCHFALRYADDELVAIMGVHQTKARQASYSPEIDTAFASCLEVFYAQVSGLKNFPWTPEYELNAPIKYYKNPRFRREIRREPNLYGPTLSMYGATYEELCSYLIEETAR